MGANPGVDLCGEKTQESGLKTSGITSGESKNESTKRLESSQIPLGLESCPQGYLSGQGPDNASLLIIDEMPSLMEERRGRALLGKAASLLRAMLRESGINLEEARYVFAIPKRTPGGRPATNLERRAFEAHLLGELQRVRPSVVLALGPSAFRFCTRYVRRGYRIEEFRGRLGPEDVRPELQQTKTIVSFRPSYLLLKQEHIPYARKDYAMVSASLSGEDRQSEAGSASEVVPGFPHTVLDLETTGLYSYAEDAKILAYGYYHSSPFGEDSFGCIVLSDISPLGFQHTHVPQCVDIVGHNIKFDLHWLPQFVGHKLWDTQIMAQLLDENRPSYSLEALARSDLGVEPWKLERSDMTRYSEAELKEYCARDVEVTRDLFHLYYRQLQKAQLMSLATYEHEVLRCVLEMERRGMQVSDQTRGRLCREAEGELASLLSIMDRVVGHRFNPMSPQQVSKELYEVRGMKPLRETDTGWSVDMESLEKLSQDNPEDPLLPVLVKYREVSSMLSKFYRPLGQWYDKYGRIHPTYNVSKTKTGRFSCSSPNVQQIPKGHVSPVKAMFVSRYPGGKIISADYSQLELRVGAWYTDDAEMRSTFAKGGDIHEVTREAIFGGKELPGQRVVAKSINFGIFYGAGPHTLAKTAGISVDDARVYRNKWFHRYPQVKPWIESLKRTLNEDWMLETPVGRRRRIILSGLDKKMGAHAINAATNFPVQSLAADITKAAMLEVERALAESDVLMVAQIHDALIFDVPPGELERAKKVVYECMLDPGLLEKFGLDFDVPLEVDLKAGDTWLGAEENENSSTYSEAGK